MLQDSTLGTVPDSASEHEPTSIAIPKGTSGILVSVLLAISYDDQVTRKAFLILNNHVESVNHKFQPCLTGNCFPNLELDLKSPHDISLTISTRYDWDTSSTSCLHASLYPLCFPPLLKGPHKSQTRKCIWRILNERADRLSYTLPFFHQSKALQTLWRSADNVLLVENSSADQHLLFSIFSWFITPTCEVPTDWLQQVNLPYPLLPASNYLYMMNNIHTVWTGHCPEMNVHTLKILI